MSGACDAAAPPPAVLTVDEAADLLRVDRKTVYTAVHRGRLPGARKIGRTIRIHRLTLLEWLSSANPSHSNGK